MEGVETMMGEALKKDLQQTLDSLTESEKGRLNGATVLVTGCAGFLGYYFLRFFQEKGGELGIKKIVALDNFMLGRPKWMDDLERDPRFTVQKFDVISDDIAALPEAAQADYIIHMASIASPAFYRKYPIETLDANIWGLRSLLDFYHGRSPRGILFYSSSEIYGDPNPENIPTDEEYRGNVSCTGPRACYDEAKRFGETMCMLFAEKYGMPIVVARPFNNYGPGMKLTDQRVPADFARAILEGRDIEILSDGSPRRTFCYIADAAAGYLKALVYGKYDYFNIGIEKPEISIRDLAEIYAEAGREIFGYQGKVLFAQSEDRHYLTHNPQRRCPIIKKAENILGYRPQIYVEEGVRRFLTFVQQSGEADLIW